MKLDEKTDAYLNALAEELRRLREAAGLSKNRLAEMAGLSQQMVSYVEKRMKQPTAGTLYRLAEALGTTVGAITSKADKALPDKASKSYRTVIRYAVPEEHSPGLVAEDEGKSKRSAAKPDFSKKPSRKVPRRKV